MIYLASPYSDPDPAVREQRFHAVCHAAASLMREGHVVYSPISHGHPISTFGIGTDSQTWDALNRRQLAWCDELLVLTLDGWEQSIGVQAAIRIARGLRRPIGYLAPEDAACRMTLAHVATGAEP